MKKGFQLLLVTSLAMGGCVNKEGSMEKEVSVANKGGAVPEINYSVVAVLPHDTTSFTEGLLFHEKHLFESTGATDNLPQTRSLFGIVDTKTGKIDTKAELDRKIYFGEGIVFFHDKVYQLTYKNQLGFIYDAKTFKKLGTFSFRNREGWGFTTDGKSLVMSDGTNKLTYLDPDHLTVIKTLEVTNNGYAEDNLNELEYINGFIYANIWTKNYIVKINPADGKIVGTLDLSSLYYQSRKKYQGSLEMNGIAYDADSDKVYVTGKMWPEMYQIKFSH